MIQYMNYILQVVPALPPSVNGLGDYALNLAKQLRQDFNIDTCLLVANPNWNSSDEIDGFRVLSVQNYSSDSLVSLLNLNEQKKIAVLLHYVGYGYEKRGCPLWLLNALKIWKSRRANKLITMFHEIAASGPPWSSAFWLSGLQKHLAKRLVKTSDRILTSKQLYAEILQRYDQGQCNEIATLPVFSNVGEPSDPSDLSKRQRRLVIFGGRGRRAKVYQSFLDQLHQICRYLDIQQIFDIGPPLDSIPTHVGDVPITATGSLPSEEVSAILSGAIAGFFNYHPAFLGKSGIFAAYCAHRMLPVSAQMTSHIEDGLYPGQHYILPEQYSTRVKNETLPQAMADNAYAWYQAHNLSAQAKTYHALLSDL